MKKIGMFDIFDLDISKDNLNKIDIDNLFEVASNYFYSADIESAKTSCEIFKNIIERDPKYKTSGDGDSKEDDPYFYLGRFHDYFLNDIDTAIEYYNKSLKLCPKGHEAFEFRGICRLEKNQYGLAIKDFLKAKKYGGGEFCDLDEEINNAKKKMNGTNRKK